MQIKKIDYNKNAKTKDYDQMRGKLYKKHLVVDSKLENFLEIYVTYHGQNCKVIVKGHSKKDYFSGTGKATYEEDAIENAFEDAGFIFSEYKQVTVNELITMVAKKLTKRKFKIFE